MIRSFLGGCAAVLLAGAAGAATLVNGDFDTTSGVVGKVNGKALDSLASLPGATWDVFNAIPGWTTLSGAGIEVQTNPTLGGIDAQSGQHYVELDSHPAGGSNSAMGQNLGKLGTGGYILSFYYSPRTANLPSMGIEYGAFGGASQSATISTGTVGVWSMIAATFFVTDATQDTTVYFKAVGEGDTLGGLIDTVSVAPAPIPVPAAALLLGSGLAALGLLRRRRRAA